MFDLYRSAARYIASSFPSIFLAALGLATLDTLGNANAALGAGLAAQVLMIVLFHSHFLYGDPPIGLFSKPPKRRLGRFLLVLLALTLLPMVVAITLSLLFAAAAGPSFTLVGLVIVTYSLAIGLFGTALPASIDRDPRYGLAMGMRRLTRTLGLIVAGPGLVIMLAIVGIVGFTALAGPHLSAPMTAIAVTTVTGVLGFFNSALTAAILCKVYREILSDSAPQST